MRQYSALCRTLICALFLLAVSSPLSAQSVGFSGPVNYSAALQQGPYSVAVADFNGDGIPDLAASGALLGVWLGTGGGKFAAPTLIALNVTLGSVVSADFNGDGKPDLAVAGSTQNEGELAVLLNLGNGTFAAPVYYSTQTGGGLSRLAAGDFNGDSKVDLAVAGGGVGVLLGNGDGTFGATAVYGTPDDQEGIVVADFNQDGKLDLATSNYGVSGSSPGSVSVFLGNGNGTFQAAIYKDLSAPALALATGDFNGDGRPDLAVSVMNSNTSDTVEILLGEGAGRFQNPVSYTLSAYGSAVSVADFNSDGKLDVAVATITGTLSFFLGNGDGTFQSTPVNFSIDLAAAALSVADLNGDTFPDAVTANQNSLSDVSVLINSGPNAPGISLNPSTLTFATQLAGSVSTSQTVTVTNTGLASLTFSSIVPSSGFLSRSDCSSVGVGKTCTVTVSFAPKSSGNVAGTIKISDNTNTSPQTVSLSGVGTFFSLTPSNLNFGTIMKGTTSPPQTATLTSVAVVSQAYSYKVTGASQSFAITDPCGGVIPAKGTCTFSITFSPKSTGNFSATFEVQGSGPAMLKTTLSGQGTR